MTEIIGFTGRKRSGKDTAAKVLIDQGHQRLAFATPMKLMLRALLAYQGVDEDTIERMIEGDLKEVPTPFLAGKSPRHAMQTLGTEWGRDCMHQDFWVHILLSAAQQHDAVVVSDVRFDNEAAILSEVGAFLVRVTRPGLVSNDNHPSETAIDTLPVHIEVANDGTIEDFHSTLKSIFSPSR